MQVVPAFADYRRGLTVRAVAAICLVNAVGLLAFWPFDHLTISSPRTLDGFSAWRISCLVAQLGLAGTVVLARRSSWGVRIACALGYAANAVLCGWYYGGMGHDHDWFQIGYIVPYTTLALIVELPERIAFTVLTAGAFAVAYLAADPYVFSRPYALSTMQLFSFSIVISTVAGHILFILLRRHHEHQTLLEARVAERTAELRELAQHLQASREQERSRVARELHDELGQVAAALRLEVDVARGHTTASGTIDPRVLGDLVRIDTAVGSLLTSIRTLVHELRPRVLDELGLAAAARAHIESLAERSKVAIVLDAPERLDVDPERATACFRVLQEALTNVIKHAKATRVEIEIALKGGELCLDVRDDGRGVTPGKKSGFGLISMRERAAALGGTVEVTAREGGGTHVRLRLPATQAVAA
jgi:signal transduction histidine kinase